MRREHEQAYGLGVELLHDVAHGEEVARGLGHLFVVHVDVAVVHPVLGKRIARRALGLGDLVFVVREDEVHAAAVDVERLAEVLHAHGRAFDVPPGAAHAPRTLPRRLAALLRLPEGKVHGMALYVPHLHARAALEIVEVLAGELAVAGAVGLRVEVDVAVYLIGKALILELFDQGDDLADVLGGAGMHVRLHHAQGFGVLEVFADVLFGDGVHGGVFLIGAADHLVVDVREILHEGYVVTHVLEKAPQGIEDDKGARVADVEVVVHRRAAGVDADFALVDGDELFLFARHGVENLHAVPSVSMKKRPAPLTEAWPRFHSAFCSWP